MGAPRFSRMARSRRAGTRSRGTDGAAAVASPAARRVLLSEVPLEEHASAFVGLGVIGDGPKPALILVTKCLELRHEIAGVSSEDLRRYHDDDAALLIALDRLEPSASPTEMFTAVGRSPDFQGELVGRIALGTKACR